MIELAGFRPPQQERSRATLDDLTTAVGALLLEAGSTDLSVRDLVNRAGTSVGAFYARFDDRDAALAYTSHDFWARSRQLWLEYLDPDEWIDASAAHIVVRVVRTFTRMTLADRRRLRAFVGLTLAVQGNRVVAQVAEHDRFIAGAMANLLAARAREVGHPHPHDAAEAGFRRVLGSVRDLAVFGEDEDPAPVILALCQAYGRGLGVRPIPSSYGELLRMAR